MVATLVCDEFQVTLAVMSCIVASVYVPVAANCCGMPSGTLGMAGVTAIETSAAAVTVRFVEPDTLPEVAVTAVLPTETLVASPEAFTIATAGVPLTQVTAPVMSRV